MSGKRIIEEPTHELWLIYKELGEIEQWNQLEPLRERLGKVINTLNAISAPGAKRKNTRGVVSSTATEA